MNKGDYKRQIDWLIREFEQMDQDEPNNIYEIVVTNLYKLKESLMGKNDECKEIAKFIGKLASHRLDANLDAVEQLAVLCWDIRDEDD